MNFTITGSTGEELRNKFIDAAGSVFGLTVVDGGGEVLAEPAPAAAGAPAVPSVPGKRGPKAGKGKAAEAAATPAPAAPAAPAAAAAPANPDPFGLGEEATPAAPKAATKPDVVDRVKKLLEKGKQTECEKVFKECAATRMGDLKPENYGKFVELADKLLAA